MAGPVESPNTLVSNTRVKIVDVWSEGPTAGFWPVSGVSGLNPMCSIYFDGVPLLNGDGSPNYNISGQGFNIAFVSGLSGQAPMPGFEKVEALVPLPYNTRVTNPPLNAAFPNTNAGYPKSVTASFNTTMYPDAEGVKVTLRFPAVYQVDQTNGNTNGFDMSWAVDISLNNGPFVTVDTRKLSDIAPSPKCTTPYLNSKIYTLPKTTPAATYYEWKVRVRRVSQNVLSANTQNDMYVDTIAVVSSNQYNYPMSSMVGIELSADQFAGVPTRMYDVKGIKVLVPDGYTPTQYNVDGTITAAVYPGIWTGGLNSRQWTDNPAWIFYDLCTNKRYGLGRYIRPEWMDKWTLYQIAQFCDEMVDDGAGGLEPRFTCNVAIQQAQDAYTLLNNFVSVFQGMLYWANGRIMPVGSETRAPVFNFTNANVVNGAFSYTDTPRNTRSTVCVIKWTDPTNLGRTTPERVEDPASIARFGYVEKQITAFATNSRGQAIRAANWLLTVEQQLTETVSFQTDIEGLYLRPGDVVNVYDNYRNNQSQGGRIFDYGTGREVVTLDKNVNLQNGFTYFMSAIVPAANFAGTGDITGSNQIGMIRNSQIEVRKVTSSPANGINFIVLESGFSSGLYKGSPWILSASGSSVTVFDQATQYKVLSTAEPQPGIVEVLGVKYQTGINYLVTHNYSSEVSAPIVGDTTPPNAPTGLTGILTTGLQIDNSFYAYLYLSWTGSTSANNAYYKVSGRLGAGSPFLIGQPTTTGINYTPTANGTYTFGVAAVNANGYESAFNTTTRFIPATNPLGVTAALSGVYIAADEDVYYIRPQDARYTGYVGTSPSMGWHITLDTNDNQTPTAQFITGYRARLLEVGNETNVLSLSDISISGADNTNWNFDPRYLYTGTTVKPLRRFTFAVDTIDEYGNVASGARLAINNPQLPPPLNSGFIGYNGGISYNVTPAPQADTSGIYLWVNQNPAFTPTYDNVNFISSNLGGNANIAPQTGVFWTWFALVDTYGFSGSKSTNGDYNAPIYGPISGNANGVFGSFFVDITAQLTGAFGYLTGAFTNLQSQITSTGYNSLLMVNGLSGSITGAGTAINNALSVQIQTTVNSTGLALASQINAVSARLVTTGQINYALAGTVMDALATTGGANSQYLTQLSAVTTGQSATLQITAQAFATGSVNGLGGAALARWGFALDANGKVTSMQATSAAFGATYGTIVFGGADLQSDTYTPGSAGWTIKHDGSAEFNNVSARGAFTGGAGTNLTTVNSDGFTVGNPGGDRVQIVATSTARTLLVYNSSNANTVNLGSVNVLGNLVGALSLNNQAGSTKVSINANSNGNIALGSSFNAAGDGTFTLGGGTATFNGTNQFNGTTTVAAQLNISSNNKLEFTNAGVDVAYIAEDYGMNLWGDTTHPIKIRGGALVRGSSAGGSYTAGDIYGFGIQMDPGGTAPCDFLTATAAGSDHTFSNYLQFKANGATVYVPYLSSAP